MKKTSHSTLTSSSQPPARIVLIRPNVFGIYPPDGGVVYIINTDQGMVLFDSSFLRHRHCILEAMQARHLDPCRIELAFVTHFHADHAGGMGWWRNRFHFQVVAHESAVEPMLKGERIATGALMPYANLNEKFSRCHIDRPVSDDEIIKYGTLRFRVIYAPGHCISSIHVLLSDMVFVGDTIFANGGIGWMDIHWGSNPEDYVETLERLRKYKGFLAMPAHGEPFVLSGKVIDAAQKTAAFYIPYEHGMGCPRPPKYYSPRLAKTKCRTSQN